MAPNSRDIGRTCSQGMSDALSVTSAYPEHPRRIPWQCHPLPHLSTAGHKPSVTCVLQPRPCQSLMAGLSAYHALRISLLALRFPTEPFSQALSPSPSLNTRIPSMPTQEKAMCALSPRHPNRKGVSILMGPMAILEATLNLHSQTCF